MNDLGYSANAYARFRGSRWFLISIVIFILIWIPWNLITGLPHFDSPDFGRLNVFLSIEASLSVALLLMDTIRQNVIQDRQIRYLISIVESIKTNKDSES